MVASGSTVAINDTCRRFNNDKPESSWYRRDRLPYPRRQLRHQLGAPFGKEAHNASDRWRRIDGAGTGDRVAAEVVKIKEENPRRRRSRAPRCRSDARLAYGSVSSARRGRLLLY